jgi:hypothetical protein
MDTVHSILWIAWIIGTSVLAIGLVIAAVIACIFTHRRRRLVFLGLAAAFIVGAVVSALANPIANLAIFNDYGDYKVAQLYEDMRCRNLEGQESSALTELFGSPSRVAELADREVWIYCPRAWFMWTGTDAIEVTIKHGRIEYFVLMRKL